MLSLTSLFSVALIGRAVAAPFDGVLGSLLVARQSGSFTPLPLSTAQQNAYLPHAHFASAAYCLQSDVQAWNCGGDCTALPNFINVTVGGNNADRVPWFVGYYNDSTADLTMTGNNDGKGTIVVSHQGTAGTIALFGILSLTPIAPSSSIFGTGVPSTARVATGFAGYHSRTQANILAAVKGKMAAYNTTKILVTGHSLGGALSVLTALQLKNVLPTGTTVSSISFAQPRIGNKALADYIGSRLNVIRHVNNKGDIVPVVPGRNATDLDQGNPIGQSLLVTVENTLGGAYTGGNMYAGQQGEIHINSDGTWYDCGATVEDNESTLCSTGLVRNVDLTTLYTTFAASTPTTTGDHNGPYDGVGMMKACTSLNPPVILNPN